MTAQTWLDKNTKRLSDIGIGTARLDCLVLLEDCLNKDRARILAYDDLLISPEQLEWLDARIKRRSRHEPLAYIRSKTEFYGRNFFVDKSVLEPRPESETMIELLKASALQRHPKLDLGSSQKKSAEDAAYLLDSRLRGNDELTIMDVGTGSGALAITAKLELPQAKVIGIDIDPNCLDVARRNAKTHHVEIEYTQGDLLEPLKNSTPTPKPSTLILLCNLPYVPNDFHINTAAEAEPRIAIFGGSDGLDLYRRMFAQLADASWQPQAILTESLPPQHDQLVEIAVRAGYKLMRAEDFIQRFEPK